MEVQRVLRKENGGIEVVFDDGCCFISRGLLDEKNMNLDIDSFRHQTGNNTKFRKLWGSQIRRMANEINQELKKVKTLPEGVVFKWIILSPNSKGGSSEEIDDVKLFNAYIANKDSKRYLLGFKPQEKVFKCYSFSLSTSMVEIGPIRCVDNQLKIQN